MMSPLCIAPTTISFSNATLTHGSETNTPETVSDVHKQVNRLACHNFTFPSAPPVTTVGRCFLPSCFPHTASTTGPSCWSSTLHRTNFAPTLPPLSITLLAVVTATSPVNNPHAMCAVPPSEVSAHVDTFNGRSGFRLRMAIGVSEGFRESRRILPVSKNERETRPDCT